MDGPTLTRRSALRFGGLAVLGLAGCGASVEAAGTSPSGSSTATPSAVAPSLSPTITPTPPTTTAADAQARLNAGNQRFASGQATHPDQDAARRTSQVSGQSPFAVVLSCVDSRVPPEIVFDQGLGDLLVARVAAPVLDPAVTGSIQFGVEILGAPLVMVLGHQDCGAVRATIDVVEGRAQPTGTAIDALVTAITPAVERARAQNPPDLLATATRYNVQDVVAQLRRDPVLGPSGARIVGGYYDIATGRVSPVD